MQDWSEYPTPFPYLKYLQAIKPSFVIIMKPLSNKREETFREGLKLMCKFFEINEQKVFKNLSFSQNPLNIFLKILHRETRSNSV